VTKARPVWQLTLFVLVMVLVMALATACGDDAMPPADAASADGATIGPASIPWLAEGTPPITASPERECPAGFRAVRTDTGVLTCRAYPAAGPESCPPGSAHFPGGAACEPIGTPCPKVGWPTGLPSDRTVVYVRAGAVGGRGSTSSPHGTIRRAVEMSPSGAIIAIAPGTYNEQVQLDDDLSLWGACPAETILTLDLVADTSVVVGSFIPGSYGISNLTVRGDGSMGIFVQGGASVRISDVVIEKAAGFGVYAFEEGTTVDIERLLVTNVTRFPSGVGGIGVQYVENAQGSLAYVVSESQDDGHLYVAEGSSATVTRFAGLGTAGGGPDARSGAAMVVQDRSAVTLSESAFWDSEGGGVLVAIGATLEARDVEVNRSGGAETLSISPSLEVRLDSTAVVEGAHFEDSLTGAVVRATRGLMMDDDPTGLGVSLEGQGVLRLERVLFEDLVRSGIVVGPEATLSATDVVLRRVDAAGGRNLGVAAMCFGSCGLERVRVEEATLVGVAVSSEGEMTLTDVAITGTRGDPDGLYGRGLEANLAARLSGDRVALIDNREVALTAFDPGTEATLRDVAILRTRPADCGDGCDAKGYGASIQNGAAVTLSGFLIDDNAVAGLQVGPGGILTAANGEVRASPIGLNIQDPTFDLSTAFTNVTFIDLDRNIDAARLPLPDPGI
jgi:hypothetical protein